MKIARLAATVVAGACLAGGGTLALVHPSGVTGATLVASSRSGFDSARDIAERGSPPSPSASADPDRSAAATPAPSVLAPIARPADDGDNDAVAATLAAANDADEANEPADANDPAEAKEPAEATEPTGANDAEQNGDGHHDDGSAQAPIAFNDGHGGDNGGHGDGSNNGSGGN
jgi:hypothetical protein